MQEGRCSITSSSYGTDEQRQATAIMLQFAESRLNSCEQSLLDTLVTIASSMSTLAIYGSVSVKIEGKEIGSAIVNHKRININANVM